MSRVPVVVGAVVVAGLIGYLVGSSDLLRPSDSAESISPDVQDPPMGKTVPRSTDTNARFEALLRETRDTNRALREAITELRTDLNALHGAKAGGSEAPTAAAAPAEWAARLRAREPDVVMDVVCRLRERLLTRAFMLEAAAKSSETGRVVGITDPNELQAFHANQTARAKAERDTAEQCRAAIKTLDSVRTLDDLARWRAANGESDP